MRNIMLHVSCDKVLDIFQRLENNNYSSNEGYSKEVKAMINEFKSNGWNVFLTSLETFDYENKTWGRVYSLSDNSYRALDMKTANEMMDVIIVRVIGTVEHNFDNIKHYLEVLDSDYKGLVINDPKAMIKGMTKYYLGEIDKEELGNRGMGIIDTKIYENTVSYSEFQREYPELDKYLMKPVCGELSYSVKNLSVVDEEYLRSKEHKIHGWIVQPIMREIYNGEYQASFLDGELIYSQKKEYPVLDNGVPKQSERNLCKYRPSDREIEILKSVIEYFKQLYGLNIIICRIDYMKDANGNLILLEFEMVNPGFFIGYMDENDKDIENITHKIRKYCEKKSIMKI